jgi:thiamine pyrophosphate-dependent acetolactate synthase large subunit-like protein
MMDREAALGLLAKHRTNEIVVRGWTEWDHIDPSERNFIGVRAMGHHGGFALGLALAQPDHRFICFEGDGGILMNLGMLVTIANANPRNLILIILNNGAYEITGGQPVPGVGKSRLAEVARGAGITRAYELRTLADLERSIEPILRESGPTFVDLHVGPRLMPMAGTYPQPIRSLRDRYLKVLYETPMSRSQ